MPPSDWQIDELTHAGDEHLDNAYVTGYDRKSATEHAQDLALLRSLGLHEQSVVVDLGAGTGTFALAVAPFCERVVAVDVSPVMLTLLRAQVEQLGLTNIEIVRGGLLSYAHAGAVPDFVYSRNVLHHLPDFWKGLALRRMAEMLPAGGVLRLHDLVYCFESSEADAAIEAWLAAARERPEEGWTRSELATHVRTEYSTYNWLLEPLLEHAGFEIRDASYRRTYAAYTCVKR